jgi:hypothetical protein
MYISVVLFLSVLLLPAVFLPVTWFPWVSYVTNNNENLCKFFLFFILYSLFFIIFLANIYTLAFNLSTIAALFICPCSGALLGFRTDRSNMTHLFLFYSIIYSFRSNPKII